MNMFFYFTLILSLGLFSSFIFDDTTTIATVLVGILAIYLIALAASIKGSKDSAEKPINFKNKSFSN